MNHRRFFAVGFVLTLLTSASLSIARPHVVERWALYLGSPQSPTAAHLFLDPFPSAYSCQTRVNVFRANAERAFCRSHLEFEIGNASDATLAADFNPFSPASWFCLPGWRTRLPARESGIGSRETGD